MKTWKKRAPDGMQSAFQEAGYAWGWMATERAFFSSAITGIAIAMSFAFIILLISTQNVY